tara:strand:+ start:41 stop:763 length:723 start_codon:yes stop_codon:yes gene_type:complete
LVSYIQVEGYGLEQGFKGVAKPSSGRPKAKGLHQEDQFFHYYYDQRGGLKSKTPKTLISQYAWWHKYNVHFNGSKRITPLTDFEKQLGVSMSNKQNVGTWYNGKYFTRNEWSEFRDFPDDRFERKTGKPIDFGNVENVSGSSLPTKTKQQSEIDWSNYFIKKAEKKDLIVINISNLEFREKQKPAVVEKIPTPARPNPKEVEKVEPVEVVPIKEVVKYSPLMIAGVIAVVVILLLKRRRA